jgi:hypothetical protein
VSAAAVKLVRLGRREYETVDKRFHIKWQARQGARSCYRVLDRKIATGLRAFTLEEVRTTIRNMRANDRLTDRLPVVHVSFQDGAPVFQAEGAAWAVRIPNEGPVIQAAPKPRKPSMPPPLLFTDFVIEMYEILREARETQAADARGRNIELYYGDMMRRLEDALDLVNDRIVRRSLGGAS